MPHQHRPLRAAISTRRTLFLRLFIAGTVFTNPLKRQNFHPKRKNSPFPIGMRNDIRSILVYLWRNPKICTFHPPNRESKPINLLPSHGPCPAFPISSQSMVVEEPSKPSAHGLVVHVSSRLRQQLQTGRRLARPRPPCPLTTNSWKNTPCCPPRHRHPPCLIVVDWRDLWEITFRI